MTRKRREKLIRQYRAERQSLHAARRKWPNLPDAYQRRAAVLTHELAELDRALRPRPTRRPLS